MESILESKKNEKLIKINSFMIAILLTSSFIAKLLASLDLISEGAVPAVFILSLLISYFSSILLGFKSFKINKYSIFFIYIILFYFLFTILINSGETYAVNYFIEFIAFGITIYLITLIPFDTSSVIYYVMLLGNLILINPVGFIGFISLEHLNDRVNMGASYAMLPSIVATVIFYFFMRKNKKGWINLVSYLANGYLFLIVLTEGTRGAVASILLLLLLVVYIKISKKTNKDFIYIYPLIMTFIAFICYVFIKNLDRFLIWMDNILSKLGIEIATITKSVNMLQDNGLTGILNGRDIVYEKAINLIANSPLFGNGIGIYADINNGTYPHNLFIQLLVEGGLLLLTPFVILFIICLWELLRVWDNNDNKIRYFILFLFIVCIPKLMLSSYLWREPSFWLLTFILISRSTKIISMNKLLLRTRKV